MNYEGPVFLSCNMPGRLAAADDAPSPQLTPSHKTWLGGLLFW